MLRLKNQLATAYRCAASRSILPQMIERRQRAKMTMMLLTTLKIMSIAKSNTSKAKILRFSGPHLAIES